MKALKEPLLHFLLMGAVIFGLHAWRQRGAADGAAATDRRIEVGAASITRLKEGWTRQFQRTPDETDLRGMVEAHIRANLDRIQIVKGWLDARGDLHEKVYDVVWSGERQPNADGKLPSVGSTVDVENATWTNTIGAPELITVWSDPDFDAKQRAFYCLRVLEIPTPPSSCVPNGCHFSCCAPPCPRRRPPTSS